MSHCFTGSRKTNRNFVGAEKLRDLFDGFYETKIH